MKILKCEKCGEKELSNLGCFDRPVASRSIVELTDDGVLLVTSSYEIDYFEESQLYIKCLSCGNEFVPKIEVGYV